MDIIIVDDEPLARQRLSKMVRELGYDVVAEVANSEEALHAIDVYDPALLLLDIEMPGENGLELAKKIMAQDTPPGIIFTTAYDQYALEAFETLATGYLLKPVEKEKLQKTLEKAKTLTKYQLGTSKQNSEASNRREHIASKGHRGIELIPLNEIRFFIADQKYVMVVSTQGKVLIDETLKELEEEFSDVFIRVHRNSLVSINHIVGLHRDNQGHYHVCLADIEDQPIISRRYTSKVKSLLNNL